MADPAARNRATTAAGRYNELLTFRSPYLERARDCAKLTIPALMPPEGSGGATELHKPYQSMGSRGVSNLAAKLLLALFPPNQSFFRLMLPPSVMAELMSAEAVRTEMERALAQIEAEVQAEVETSATRVSVIEALKQLIVAGNVALHDLPNGGLKVYRLDRYVVKRDPAGSVIEAIIHERVSPTALPDQFLVALKRTDERFRTSPHNTLDIYTWLRRDGDRFLIHQEAGGQKVPGTDGEYPVDRCPFIFLRWTKVDGEDYGRSHADELFGDLRSLEGLSAAIVEGSAAAAKVVVLVDPTGTTALDTIAKAPNLAVRSGRAQDVTTLKVDKAADFGVALNTAQNIERRLSQAFLMASAVQRNAERVTAEEIRLLAGELEDALGGVYALLSQELQLPYVRAVMARLARAGRIPELPKDIRPAIVTGLQALGRSHELNRLMMLGRAIQELLGPNAINFLNPTTVIQTIATSVGIDAKGLIKTEEQLAQEKAIARQQALIEKLAPEAIRARVQLATQHSPEAESDPTPQE